MKKQIIALSILVAAICGCSQTPNNISLGATQGQCVTGTNPGYESTATSYSAAFPINANLPATAPYCIALTLTNNNSGQNANNIQVNGYGLVLGYTSSYSPSGNTTSSASMIDFNAAGVSSSSFSNTYQQISNIALFDPNNCVTTLGPNVRTLYTNGDSCTFYVEIVNESMPIGVYPLNFSVNYTNGNANYSVGININERSNLYAGGAFPQNIALTNAQSTSPTINTFVSANSPESYSVKSMTRDAFGNVYTGDIFGNVYKYTGESIGSWYQIPNGTGGLPGGASILAMTADSVGNVYLINALGQVYQLQYTSFSLDVNDMGTISVNPAYLTSMQVVSNQLYISNNNNVYSCGLSTISSSSCNPTVYITGPDTVINQLVSSTNTFNIAGATGVWAYNGGSWVSIPDSGTTGLPGLPVDSIAYFNNVNFTGSPFWYAGITQAESTQPSVYIESGNAAFIPLLSPSGQNILSGNISNIVIDNAQGVFVGGVSLQSNDFPGTQAPVAYLISPTIATVSSEWTPITGISGAINTMQTASQLTPY